MDPDTGPAAGGSVGLAAMPHPGWVRRFPRTSWSSPMFKY